MDLADPALVWMARYQAEANLMVSRDERLHDLMTFRLGGTVVMFVYRSRPQTKARRY